MSEQLDRNALKIQALNETIYRLTNEVADLRVEITIAQHMLEQQTSAKTGEDNVEVSEEN